MTTHKVLFLTAALPLLSGCLARSMDVFRLKKVAFQPLCAQACRAAMTDNSLECTTNVTLFTSGECYASNLPFLATLAFCIKDHCSGLSESQIDDFWSRNAVGWDSLQPLPQYSYEEALRNGSIPVVTIHRKDRINTPSLIREGDYFEVRGLLSMEQIGVNSCDICVSFAPMLFQKMALRFFRLALLCSGLLAPVVLSILGKLCPRNLNAKFHIFVIYPPAWPKQWHINGRETEDINPTRGQRLYVLLMVVFNIGLSIPGLMPKEEDPWEWDNRDGRFTSSLANRLGALSSKYPLLFLYCGRNNFILWLTRMSSYTVSVEYMANVGLDWSHSTFLVLHRWIGYISILQAAIHSVLFLQLANNEGKLSVWSKAPAWYTGAIAAIALAIIIPFSVTPIRRRLYEFFLTAHIYIGVVVVIGLFYHLYYLFGTRSQGYGLYIWAVVTAWGCERFARVVRLVKNGLQKATITHVDDEYIRVDIPRAKVKGHAYLYFPTLTWRFWENHPFSAISPTFKTSNDSFFHLHKRVDSNIDTMYSNLRDSQVPLSPLVPQSTYVPARLPMSPISPRSPFSPASTKINMNGPLSPTDSFSELLTPTTLVGSVSQHGTENSVTFYLRTHAGTTGFLRHRSRLPVLVESSYGIPADLTSYPLLICIAGGVGITAILPHLYAHNAVSRPGRTKLFWGSRSQALVQALHDEVVRFEGEISVGKRLDVTEIVRREISAAGEHRDIAVVVSGPKEMADEVRRVVCDIGRRRKGAIRLVDECFGW